MLDAFIIEQIRKERSSQPTDERTQPALPADVRSDSHPPQPKEEKSNRGITIVDFTITL